MERSWYLAESIYPSQFFAKLEERNDDLFLSIFQRETKTVFLLKD